MAWKHRDVVAQTRRSYWFAFALVATGALGLIWCAAIQHTTVGWLKPVAFLSTGFLALLLVILIARGTRSLRERYVRDKVERQMFDRRRLQQAASRQLAE